MKIKINKEEVLFNNRFLIEKADISLVKDNGEVKSFDRMRLQREDAAAVLIYHKDRDSFILIRQFRYAAGNDQDLFLEIAAGKVESGELPLETIVRETEEETGYVLKATDFELLASFYASPGYTTEKYFLYYAEVTNSTPRTKGGGLEQESEFIELVEIPANAFFNGIRNSFPPDAKTLMAGYILLQRQSGK